MAALNRVDDQHGLSTALRGSLGFEKREQGRLAICCFKQVSSTCVLSFQSYHLMVRVVSQRVADEMFSLFKFDIKVEFFIKVCG